MEGTEGGKGEWRGMVAGGGRVSGADPKREGRDGSGAAGPPPRGSHGWQRGWWAWTCRRLTLAVAVAVSQLGSLQRRGGGKYIQTQPRPCQPHLCGTRGGLLTALWERTHPPTREGW